MKYPEIYKFINALHPLTESDWSAAGEILKEKKMKKDELFIREGEAVDRYAIITKGIVRLYHQDEHGKQYTKAFRAPLSLVCPYAEALMRIPSQTYVEAVTNAVLFVGKLSEFFVLMSKYPSWNGVGRVVAEKMYIEKAKREFEFLKLSATERYRVFVKESPEVVDLVPQYQIASYLGITPVALSRLRGRKGK